MLVACPQCQKLISENALTCPRCGEPSAGSQALAIQDALRKEEIIDFLCRENVLHRFAHRLHITLTGGSDFLEYWNEVDEARLTRVQQVWRILLNLDPDTEDFPSLIGYRQPYQDRRYMVIKTLMVINTITTDEGNRTAAAWVSLNINRCFRHICDDLDFEHFDLDDLSFIEPMHGILGHT